MPLRILIDGNRIGARALIKAALLPAWRQERRTAMQDAIRDVRRDACGGSILVVISRKVCTKAERGWRKSESYELDAEMIGQLLVDRRVQGGHDPASL